MRIRVSIMLFFGSLLLAYSATVLAGPQRELQCRQCTMHIADDQKKFSVIVPAGIEFSAFDDIGCAMAWRANECAMRQEAFDNNAVVHDFGTGEEVPIQKAFFIVDSGVRTPMGYGVVAFESKVGADAFVAERKQGKIVTYAVLDDFLKEPPMQMEHHRQGQGGMQHHDMKHHGSGE